MYSVVLLAAMTAGGQTPDHHGCFACGGGYGSCYGNFGVDSWNCYGGGYGSHYSGCYGGYSGCTGGYSCSGAYLGRLQLLRRLPVGLEQLRLQRLLGFVWPGRLAVLRPVAAAGRPDRPAHDQAG